MLALYYLPLFSITAEYSLLK